MKQFRLFTAFLMALLCAILVTSCSKDDKEPTSLIIGKWQVIGDDGVPEDDGIEFRSNGTWIDYDPSNKSYGNWGRYWIESEILYMRWGDDGKIWKQAIEKLNSKEMILMELDGDWKGSKTLWVRIR